MSLQTGLGIAFSLSAPLAGTMAASRAQETLAEPDVALVFSAAELDAVGVLAGVRSILGDVPVWGTTAQTEISNLGQTEGTVVVLLLASEDVDFSIHSAGWSGCCASMVGELAESLKRAIPNASMPTTSLLVATELEQTGFKKFQALAPELPMPLPISGGGSVPPRFVDAGHSEGGSAQYCGDSARERHLSMLVLRGKKPDALRFGYAFSSSSSPIAPSVKVTDAEGSLVKSVDGQPLLKYLESYLGEDFREKLKNTAQKYSFLARLPDPDRKVHVVRSPIWSQFSESGVEFFPRDEMQDRELQLVQFSRQELLEGTDTAARAALEALDGATPVAVFLFSCQLRRSFLHSRGDEEVERIRQVFGDAVPLCGFYAGGEYAPAYSRYDEVTDPELPLSGSRLLSTSISIVAVGVPGAVPPAGARSSELAAWLRKDRNREYEDRNKDRRIQELLALLAGAEAMVDETEAAFKHINREHFLLAEELKAKNDALARANLRSDRLASIIQRYTPHNVWRKAGRSVDDGTLDIPDEETVRTFMFLDVKGFTAYSETHSPEEVLAALNEIFEPATAIIYDNHGDIDKFIGDCIFATFDEVAPALESGLEILDLVGEMAEKGSPFSVRVGINTGRVVSGNVGGELRRDNTLIGDAVNIAQRMESACTPGAVLLSAASFKSFGGEVPEGLVATERQLTVKGKAKPVPGVELRRG